ncbi:hypothetical protein AAG906_010787 [Vitis piasezkii]
MAPRMMDYRSLSNLSLNPMIQVPNLPENAEATTDVPCNRVQFLKIASDLFQEPMARFKDASTPDWNSPNGSEQRTKDRGVVCTTWALQLKMLTHASIGSFLSHSEWSSVVKALHLARPLILLTFLAGQGLNANCLQEKEMKRVFGDRNRQNEYVDIFLSCLQHLRAIS